MSNYRITTTDGFILDSTRTRKVARQNAEHRARYMGEPMIVQRWNEDIGWTEIERVMA